MNNSAITILIRQWTLAFRAYAHAFSNQPVVEVPAQPDSRHLFLRVNDPAQLRGELGYYQPGRQWKTVARIRPDNNSA